MKSTVQKARKADMKAIATVRWASHDVLHQAHNPITKATTKEICQKLKRLSRMINSDINRDALAQDILTLMENSDD